MVVLGIGWVAAGAAAAAFIGAPREAPPRRPLPPDPVPAAAESASIAATASSLYAGSWRGRIVRLDTSALRVAAGATDAARPGDLVVSGREVFVADDGAITLLRAGTLAPVAAFAVEGRAVLGGGRSAPVVAAWSTGGGGRVCVVAASGLGPCADLAFAPTGVGSAAQGTVAVADGVGARVVLLRVRGYRLAVVRAVALPRGSAPRGALVTLGSRVAVAARRSIVVVDLSSGALVRRIPLRTTPTNLAAAGDRVVVAPLYGSDRVDLVEIGAGPVVRRSIRTAARPVVAAATGRTLFVVTASDGRLSRFRLATGEPLGAKRVRALGERRVERVTVRSVAVHERDKSVLVSVPLAGERLDPAGLVVRKLGIGPRGAVLEVWQGGIRTKPRTLRRDGIVIRSSRGLGRVRLTISADPRRFERLSASLSRDGRALVIKLVKVPPAPAPVPDPDPTPDYGSHYDPRPDPDHYRPTPEPEPNPCETDPISCMDFG